MTGGPRSRVYQLHRLAPLLSATATPAPGRLRLKGMENFGRDVARVIWILLGGGVVLALAVAGLTIALVVVTHRHDCNVHP